MNPTRTAARQSAPGWGSVSAGEVLPLREAARRLGWERKTIAKAQRDGLRCVLYGRIKYVTGEALVEFFDRQAERQAAEQEGGPSDG